MTGKRSYLWLQLTARSLHLRPIMQVHRTIEGLPSFSNAVITIGTFDGVHEGHKKIIDALIKEARSANGESVIISFDPHPRKVVNPHEHLQLINTLDEKIELLSQTEEREILCCLQKKQMRMDTGCLKYQNIY